MNDSLDEVLAVLNTLICDHGAYQINLDLVKANVTLRFVDSPFSCRLYGANEIMNRQFSLTYPVQPYLAHAKLSQDTVSIILGQFAVLRVTDGNIRLNEASLNSIDGLLGLTFSDGRYYRMTVDEFLSDALPSYPTDMGDRFGT